VEKFYRDLFNIQGYQDFIINNQCDSYYSYTVEYHTDVCKMCTNCRKNHAMSDAAIQARANQDQIESNKEYVRQQLVIIKEQCVVCKRSILLHVSTRRVIIIATAATHTLVVIVFIRTLAGALLYAFLAALSKSAFEKLRCDTSFDRIIVDDEQSPRADQMNQHATNIVNLLIAVGICDNGAT